MVAKKRGGWDRVYMCVCVFEREECVSMWKLEREKRESGRTVEDGSRSYILASSLDGISPRENRLLVDTEGWRRSCLVCIDYRSISSLFPFSPLTTKASA
jgi:hypothetical protein